MAGCPIKRSGTQKPRNPPRQWAKIEERWAHLKVRPYSEND
jgi:hypothetical protein